MKALVARRYGPVEGLKIAELSRPKPKPDEVLIETHFAGVNPLDWKCCAGELKVLTGFSFPKVFGHEVCGRVVEIGKSVQKFKVGDMVFGMLGVKSGGGFADYVVAKEEALAEKPGGLGTEEAGVFPLCALTAFQALTQLCHLEHGASVLVIGASGGVGHIAIQIARAMGARVIGVSSSKNRDFILGLGADAAISYDRQTIAESDEKYDLVFDTVNAYSFETLLPRLKDGGTYIGTVPSPGLLKSMAVSFFSSGPKAKLIVAKPSGTDLAELSGLIEAHSIRPFIEKTFSLDKAVAALALSQEGRVAGKLGIKVI